ncbi:MAG: PKD domain-containing protein, partial [Dehalococcoidia bacterium]|nr:PKD domain-containing protein [Dehalococcoidia bacterium]
INEQMDNIPGYGYIAPKGGAFVRMSSYDNWYGTEPPPNYSVSVNEAPLTPAAPSGPTSGEAGTSYTYRVKTTDPDGDTITYTIDWGDGESHTTGSKSSGTTAYPGHAWSEPGTYAVRVRATDSEGDVSAWSPSLSVTITVPAANQPPLTPAAPSGAAGGESGTLYRYAVTTTDPDGDSIAYTIDWGDGTSSTTDQLDSGAVGSLIHTWSEAGTYLVKVRATDSEGNVSAWSPTLAVNMTTPGQVPLTPGAPQGTASGESGVSYAYSVMTTDPNGDSLTYTIDWGDGTSSTIDEVDSGAVASAIHAWSEVGTYQVKVKATDSEGNTSEWSLPVSVSISAPDAAPPADGATGEGISGVLKSLVKRQETSPADGTGGSSMPPSPIEVQPLSVPEGGSGLVWWLVITSALLGAAVLLVRAVVVATVPERSGGDFK